MNFSGVSSVSVNRAGCGNIADKYPSKIDKNRQKLIKICNLQVKSW